MRFAFVALLTLFFLLSSGCSAATSASRPEVFPPATPPPGASPFPLTVTDDAGREVTIEAEPRRIVSLAASNTEILFAVGAGEKVVGVDQYSDFPPAAREKPTVGGYSRPDLEKIVALEPDLILGTGIHVKATLPELERRGLTSVIVDPRDVKGVMEKIRLVGKATGRRKEAEALADALLARVESVAARLQEAEPVRTFYELSPSLHTAGPGSFVDDLIRLAGGANVAAGAGKEWPQMNQEALFLADPEVILLADHGAGETPEQVAARPGWSRITAVKTGRVVAIEPNLVNRPGPRVVEGLELVARTLHPARMK